ncbi:MAG: XRE family transcriptional regulator [Paludibacteraceae bacterium]|nr:XRE family transcriptional regulator [Paludibacteraceae bacterium]
MAIHIGHRIKEELRRQGRSVTWLSRQLSCDRTNIYNIFRRQSIDTCLLQRISLILGHDFFADLSVALCLQDDGRGRDCVETFTTKV